MVELVADKRFTDSAITDQSSYVQSMSRLASGGFIAVWDPQSGSGPIFGQIFDAAGAELGAPIQLSATGGQPSVTGLANGGFALSWRSNGNGAVVTRAFDAAGNPVGPETQTPATFFVERTQTIATPSGYVVGWVAGLISSKSVFLQAFNATGAAIGARVTLPDHKEYFSLASLDDGRVLVASGSQVGSDPFKITARAFDPATGTMAASDLISIVLPAGTTPDAIDVVQLASGKILVSWNVNGTLELSGAIFSASGTATGETFSIATTTANQSTPIAALDNGGFIATYNIGGNANGKVVAQLFGDDAQTIGSPFTVNAPNDVSARGPVVTAFGSNDFAIGWSTDFGTAADSAVRSYFSFAHFQLNTADGLTASLSGQGTVFGTNGFQDITILPESSDLAFDASFNRGGDIVRLPGKASEYSVILTGSAARFSNGDIHVSIPVGLAGMAVVFDDGARNLVYDAAANVVKIGGQTISTIPASIAAAGDITTLPTGADPTAAGNLIFSAKGEAKIAANLNIFGTNDSEHLAFTGGKASLDASFNRGGDTVTLADSAGSTTAYQSGSAVVLTTSHGVLTIPVGTTGLTLDFAGDERVLRYDAASASIKIGTETISATSLGTAQHLDPGQAPSSLGLLADNFTAIA